jgi:flagellar hook assembly protein FlgD
MIRPNFVNLIDIGVTSIVTTVSPTSVTAVVSYGIYAQSQNPNVVAQGTVTITDANKNVVASQEQRVFLVNQPPYMTNATATFTFTGLAKGPYTITAAINNGNDENLINNTYSRTFTVVFAPVTVVIDGSTSAAKMDQIASSYADQGMSVNFVKVSSFAFPSEGYVVWAASMTPEQAAAARAFAAKGNTFAMLTEPNSDALNNTFALFATQKETESMNARLHVPSDIVIPTRDYSMLSSLQTVPMINATPDQEENAAKRLGGFIEYLNNMKFGNDNLNRINSKGRVYDHSEDMRIVAKRIGSVTVSELAMTKTSDAVLAVSQISNPSNFELAQNYPNPFNPSTTVAYNLPSAAQVSVRVYDLLGREVAVLANASQAAGKYLVAWDGRSSQGGTVASGMYLYRMEATPLNGSASFSTTKKMMFAK